MRVLPFFITIFLVFTLTVGDALAVEPGGLALSTDEEQKLKDLRTEAQVQDNMLFLKRLEDQYQYSRSGFNQVTQTVKDTKAKLRDVYSKGSTLKQELHFLDQAIDVSNKKLIAISNQLAKKSNLVDLLEADIAEQEGINEDQKKFVGDYVNFLYRQEQNTFSENDEDIEAFKFLLAENTFSQISQESDYFDLLHESASQTMEKVADSEEKLNEAKEKYAKEKDVVSALKDAQQNEQDQLNSQKEFKQNLLEQTKGEEEIYAELLEKSKKEQEDARADLMRLKDNLNLIKNKIDTLGADFDPAAYKDLLDRSSQKVYEFYMNAANRDDVAQMAWPVLPSAEKGISAYFHDENYKRWAGIPHNAIDIPTPQGTTIRSPLECVVYKVKDNGYGYSYVILACKGGFLLTFGHVSEFIAQEGDKLHPGDPVALSGATPGTKGAGHLTTGAHLHFEVMKDGQYKDPLDYLDLTLLPYQKLPEQYQAMVKAQIDRRTETQADDLKVNVKVPTAK